MRDKKTLRFGVVPVAMAMLFGLLALPRAEAAAETPAEAVQLSEGLADGLPAGEEDGVEELENEPEIVEMPGQEPDVETPPPAEAEKDADVEEVAEPEPEAEPEIDDLDGLVRAPATEPLPEHEPEADTFGVAEAEEEDLPEEEEPEEEAYSFSARNIKEIFAEINGEDPSKYPDAAMWSILTGFDLIFYDAAGAETDTPTIDCEMDIAFRFTLPEDVRQRMGGGEYYDVALPEELSINTYIELDLYHTDEGGGEHLIGTLTVQPGDPTVVRLAFSEAVRNWSNIQGTVEFDGKLDENSILVTGPVEIWVPYEDHLPGVPISVRPSTESMVEKGGIPLRRMNANSVLWTVDINKAMDSLTNVRVRDVFDTGTVLDMGSVVVKKLDIDTKGNVVGESDASIRWHLETATENGEEAVYVVFDEPLDAAYRIQYTCAINDELVPDAGGKVELYNEAHLLADELEGEFPADATIDLVYGDAIEKRAAAYDANGRVVTWQIDYNFNERSLPAPVLTDSFGSSQMELVPDSFVVKTMAIGDDGKATETGILEADAYTVEKASDGFVLRFEDDIDYAVRIEYKTRGTSVVTDSYYYYNHVQDQFGRWDEAERSGGHGNITKQGTLDSAAKTISWRLTVNASRYTLSDWWIDDWWVVEGLTFNDDLKVFDVDDGNSELELGRDYTLTPSGKGFRIDFTGTYATTDHRFTITFTTGYDAQATEGLTRIYNEARLSWANGEYSSGTSGYVTLNSWDRDNGGKLGSYNAQTKQITWSVFLDYSGNGMLDAVLTDPIGEGQRYVDGSLGIWSYTISANGDVTKTAQLPLEDFEWSVQRDGDGNETIVVKFPDGPGRYWVEFNTTLEDTLIKNSYDNTATFENRLTGSHPLTAGLTVAYGGEVVSKDGGLVDGWMTWQVLVNGSQSTMRDVVVRDTPSPAQLIDMGSLVVWPMVAAADGSLTRAAEPAAEGEVYEAEYCPNDEGAWELTIRFAGTLNTAYEIEYRVKLMLESGGEVELYNDVTITGEGEETVDNGDRKVLNVDVNGARGVAIGTLGGVTFRKVDEASEEQLPGAVFQLYDDAGEKVAAALETDQNGEVSWTGLVYGYYILRELTAPEGWSIHEDLWEGLRFEVNDATSAAGAVTEVADPQGEVTVRKVSSDGTPLPGAAFRLQRQEENGVWADYTLAQELVTGSDGALTLYGLPEGTYRLFETEAPEGHRYDPAVSYEFTVDLVDGTLVASGPETIVDQPTEVRLQKRSVDGDLLPGAVFLLERWNANDREWQAVHMDAPLVTDGDGMLVIQRLPVGEYRLTEQTAPEGHRLNRETWPFTLTATDPGPVELGPVIDETTGVQLQKLAADESALAGATFRLERWEQGPGDWVVVQQDLKTDENGQILLTRLAAGEYRFIETDTPDGYLLDAAPWPFTVGQNDEGVVEVGPVVNQPTRVMLVKQAEDGDLLENAVFRLERWDDVAEAWVTVQEDLATGEDGTLTLEGLYYGEYRFIETEAPDGYLLDETPWPFTISQDGAAMIMVGPMLNGPTSALLRKLGPVDELLPDAEYRLERYNSGLDEWFTVEEGLVTDEAGEILVEGLLFGRYRFIETLAPEGYLLDPAPIEFAISQDAAGVIEVGPAYDEPNGVRLIKTGEGGMALAGAEFLLEKWDMETLRWQEVADLTTDKNGEILVEELVSGRYRFTETAAPEGYLLEDVQVTFEISRTDEETVTVGPVVNELLPEELEESIPSPGSSGPVSSASSGGASSSGGGGASSAPSSSMAGTTRRVTGATGTTRSTSSAARSASTATRSASATSRTATATTAAVRTGDRQHLPALLAVAGLAAVGLMIVKRKQKKDGDER